MNFWSGYWIAWILAFLAPELWALYANPYDTLSENVWRFEDLNMQQPWDFHIWTETHWLVAIVVWLLFLWLSLHFPFGLLR